MDTTLSVGDLTALTGASAPTIRSAAPSTGTRTGGGHRRFTPAEAAAIVSRTGITPRVDGLTPTEVRVLAALARSPKGLRSARSAARRASVSPTAAGRALRTLADKGLATATTERVAAGRVADVTTWRVAITDEWLDLAPAVLRTRPPVREPDRPPRHVPRRFWHLFWSDNPSRLQLPDNAAFVARRMIGSDDLEAAGWAVAHLPSGALRDAARARGWHPSTRALALNAADRA